MHLHTLRIGIGTPLTRTGVLGTSQTKTWVGRFELILQDDRQSRYWNNRNHTVGRLRSSNWNVEGYHQYRHDDGNAG